MPAVRVQHRFLHRPQLAEQHSRRTGMNRFLLVSTPQDPLRKRSCRPDHRSTCIRGHQQCHYLAHPDQPRLPQRADIRRQDLQSLRVQAKIQFREACLHRQLSGTSSDEAAQQGARLPNPLRHLSRLPEYSDRRYEAHRKHLPVPSMSEDLLTKSKHHILQVSDLKEKEVLRCNSGSRHHLHHPGR